MYQPMTITAYTDEDFNVEAGDPFVVWINPASYSHDYPVEYTIRQVQGGGGPSPDFSRIGQDKVSFDLIFDGTGVVPPPTGQSLPADGVAGLVAQLQTLIASYNGSIHRPNFVKLSWGRLDFQCVLESMNVKYTLFKPDGTALRATATLSFLGFMSEQQLAKIENKQSPDLTHTVTVQAGDTLPALCYKIYGSSIFYTQ